MDFINSPLAVLVILGIVAVAAVVYEPAEFVGAWRALAKLYATDRRPLSAAFPGESVALGVHNYTHIDAALDDEGLWMMYDGPDPKKAPAGVLIPWDCIRFVAEDRGRHRFQIRAKKDPIEFRVSPEFGTALQRRSLRAPNYEDSA